RADRRLGYAFTDARHQFRIVSRRVRPIHRAENASRTALKRNVKMPRHAWMRRDEIDDFRHDLQWLNRTEAQTLQAREFECPRNQIVKCDLAGQVAAVGSKMNAGKHDLLVTA